MKNRYFEYIYPDLRKVSLLAAALILPVMSGCGTNTARNTVLAPSTAIIRGDLGYPAEWVPPMVIYAENTRTDEIFYAETNSSHGVLSYGLEVSAPGNYIVYVWTKAGHTTEESQGSYYFGGDITEEELPTDLSMKEVSVEPGEMVEGIDIFYFGDLPRRVPTPPSAYRLY